LTSRSREQKEDQTSMNALIDTNVILDGILERVPNADAAQKINQFVVDGHIDGYLTANCLTDIFYIVSKNLGGFIAKKIIKNLLVSFSVVSVDGDDCLRAVDFPMQDFEDALVVVCAEKAALSYIVTNDKEFLREVESSITTVTPADFVSIVLKAKIPSSGRTR